MNILPTFPDSLDLGASRTRMQGAADFASRHRWLLLFVLLPTVLATVYYGLIASDQYVSESRFIVKSTSDQGRQMSSIASLIQTTGLSRGQEETSAVMDYIRSRDGLTGLQKTTDVRQIFERADVDRLSRYPTIGEDPTKFENLFDYYKDKVDVHLDMDSGLAVLKVKAFDPAAAEKLNARLLELSEQLVNRLNARAQDARIVEAERRVRDAQDRVRLARVKLAQFRNDQRLMDPELQARSLYEIVKELTARRAGLQAQLDQMLRQTPANPSIGAIRSQIAAISRELNGLTGLVVGGGQALSSKVGGYESLTVEQEFATAVLKAAGTELEQARVEAQNQQFYLETVVEPNLPDKALYPKRVYAILTIFGACLCLYFIGWMLIVGILEHSPED